MKRLAFTLLLLSLGWTAIADETEAPSASAPPSKEQGTRDPASAAQPKRNVQEASDAATGFDDPAYSYPEPRRRKQSQMFGLQFGVYYDPFSTYNRSAAGIAAVNQVSWTTGTGMGGVQLLLAATVHSDFEFATGIDYQFPINIQGQQSAFSNFYVNNQTLNVMGLKVIQIGYRVPAGNFTIVPYGGLGLYYGKDVLNLTNATAGATDQVTYSKLTANFYAGCRMDFNFNDSHSFVAGLGIEFFVPTKLADQISQSGGNGGSAEVPGGEVYLQPSMDFMTGIGGRIMGNAAVYF